MITPIPRSSRPLVPIALAIVLGGCATFGARDGGDGLRDVDAWTSGALAGFCPATSTTDEDPAPDPVVDLVAIPVATLLASPGVGAGGWRVRGAGDRASGGADDGREPTALEQLSERIDRYRDVRALRVHGAGDEASTEASDRVHEHLARTRVASRASASERGPLTRALLGADGARVVVELRAGGIRAGQGRAALCAPRTRVADAAPGHGATRSGGSTEGAAPPIALERFGGTLPLSPGDRLRLAVVGDEDLDGIYEIGIDGTIEIPYLAPVPAAGRRVAELERDVRERLIEARLVRPAFALVDVAVLQWALADVYLRGAVFEPGRKTINAREVAIRDFKQTQRTGDSGRGRSLSEAVRAAGGVRPDADLTGIRVHRGGETLSVDLGGLLTGRPVEDVPLIDGDEVEVPSLGIADPELMRPSPLTRPVVNVFVSNVTQPSSGFSSGSGDIATLPYGTRLLDVMLTANCVGGSLATSGARRVVLLGHDPVSGRREVIEREIRSLLDAPEDPVLNPYLMPDDGVACYDSGVTNLRDVARAFTDVLSPLVILKTLTGR